MDLIEYDIFMRALRAVDTTLEVIDLDEMLATAIQTGHDSDVDLILAMRDVKEENHR